MALARVVTFEDIDSNRIATLKSEIEDGEKYRRRPPRHRMRQEAVVRRRADAAHLGPVIEAFDQRHCRHQAQKQDEVLGPGPGHAQTFAGADRLEHVARPGRSLVRLIAHPAGSIETPW